MTVCQLFLNMLQKKAAGGCYPVRPTTALELPNASSLPGCPPGMLDAPDRGWSQLSVATTTRPTSSPGHGIRGEAHAHISALLISQVCPGS